MKTLIKNAQVVLPTGVEPVSVLLENGQIAAVDAAIHAQADETVDAAGLHLLPGVVDDPYAAATQLADDLEVAEAVGLAIAW